MRRRKTSESQFQYTSKRFIALRTKAPRMATRSTSRQLWRVKPSSIRSSAMSSTAEKSVATPCDVLSYLPEKTIQVLNFQSQSTSGRQKTEAKDTSWLSTKSFQRKRSDLTWRASPCLPSTVATADRVGNVLRNLTPQLPRRSSRENWVLAS